MWRHANPCLNERMKIDQPARSETLSRPDRCASIYSVTRWTCCGLSVPAAAVPAATSWLVRCFTTFLARPTDNRPQTDLCPKRFSIEAAGRCGQLPLSRDVLQRFSAMQIVRTLFAACQPHHLQSCRSPRRARSPLCHGMHPSCRVVYPIMRRRMMQRHAQKISFHVFVDISKSSFM